MARAKPAHSGPHLIVPGSEPVPKLCGGDCELGNFILGLNRRSSTGDEASRALLREIKGNPGDPDEAPAPAAVPQTTAGWTQAGGWGAGGWSDGYNYGYGSGDGYGGYGSGDGYGGYGYGYNPQDWGRRFLATNGGCAYIDLFHLELCLPEVLSAYDHVAYWHAMLRIAQDAQLRASAKLPAGQKLQVLVNNSDGQGQSYGSHFDILVSRRCYDNLFAYKLQQMLFLASYFASSIVFTGAGKVGSENGQPRVHFQLAQRADFFETIVGPQTTYRRPLVNSRDEGLCGRTPAGASAAELFPSDLMARLHVIGFDNSLNHGVCFLKAGVSQVIAAMLEQDVLDPGLILDDPLPAVVAWSHDVSLTTRARVLAGRDLTAVEVQLALHDLAGRFVAAGRADGIVPHAADVLELWGDTLAKLKAYQDSQDPDALTALAPRLDWALKHQVIRRALAQRRLDWDAPQAKYLDHLYASLDPAEGIYWNLERDGLTERIVSDAQIERCVHEPPEDTRAWLRAHLLRRAGPDEITHADWDTLRFKFPRGDDHGWPRYHYRTLALDNPLQFTRAQCEAILDRASSLQESVEALGASDTYQYGSSSASQGYGRTGYATSDYLPATIAEPAQPAELGSDPLDLDDPGPSEGDDHGRGSA